MQRQQQQPLSRAAKTPMPLFSQEMFHRDLVQTFIACNWSFRTLEHDSLKRLLRLLRPTIQIPSRSNFMRLLDVQFASLQTTLLQDLDPSTKVSVALDGWSANNHLSFVAIKGYFISTDWQLQERLLDMIPLRGRHSGENMATGLLKTLRHYKIEKRLLAITADNASNNVTLRKTIQRELHHINVQWDHEENAVPCLAHIINLVVQDILRHLQLSAPGEEATAGRLQKRHLKDITESISVPNSLRKVRWPTNVIKSRD